MKNFFDFQDEKITEKAFSKNIIVSIAGILLSIVMLCSTTYAWFTVGISSGDNKVEAGHFSLDVTVAPVVNDVAGNAIDPDASGVYTLSVGTYVITLEPTAKTNVKGYCLINVNGAEYRTEVIVNERTANGEYRENSPFVFNITVEETTALTLESRWGIPANADVTAGGTLTLSPSSNP